MNSRPGSSELAPQQINVNNLAPGMVLTPFNQPAIDDPTLLEEQCNPSPGSGRPSRRRSPGSRCSLASSDADYVTGATYVMDGGLMRNLGQGA